ncbi:hypothetical protein D0Z08_31015 [Nocardioides immobilis]|uniref:Uncharacterized protein n=1 Tax=Nocardioides immobilis TaxID=2049295 RepID=A0A417XSE4_9ACTN|nr:hypothetical protein [Nocardioides immobilis]RHW22802.1 hypothetical protein D0Z08_31015 [Nocardioides immobilis]
MDVEEHDRALTYLIASLEGMGAPELLQAVVAAGSDSTSTGGQLVASLRALRNNIAASDRTRVRRVLDGLNAVASTETGEPISGVYLELTEAEARAAGTDRLDLTEDGDDLRDLLVLLDDLISELLDDGALDHGSE